MPCRHKICAFWQFHGRQFETRKPLSHIGFGGVDIGDTFTASTGQVVSILRGSAFFGFGTLLLVLRLRLDTFGLLSLPGRRWGRSCSLPLLV